MKVHRLLQAQLKKASANDQLDLEQLYKLVSETYSLMEADKLRSDEISSVMADEMDKLNSELQSTIQEMSLHNLRFEAAVNNMFQGLSMFDENDRLVIWNKQFEEIFEAKAGSLHPGFTLYEAICASDAYAPLSEKNKLKLAEEMTGTLHEPKPTEFLARLPDGRTLKVSHEPIEGKGSVQTTEDITERVRTDAQIRHMAHHDALTGVTNRILFNQRLEEATKRQEELGENSAIFCIDLDRFKEVNDTMGHAVGDRLLIEVAQRLKELLKAADTLSRLGGDEFAIIQAGVTDKNEVKNLAASITEEISLPYYIDGNEVIIGTSVGIVMCDTDNPGKPYELLRNADLALYKAKAERNGSYHFFEQQMTAQLQLRKKRETELRLALSENHFEMYYQPQVSCETEAIVGVEALIRWNHPVRGKVSPGEFIDLSEEIGLITPMTEFALSTACSNLSKWPDIKVSVNLSPLQFRKPGVYEMVSDILMETGFPPDMLELEITEGALLVDSEATLETLKLLKSIGVSIAMDDFGTGYSSLSYLRSFPFDKLKIDQSFVRELGCNDEADSIVQAVIKLGKSLGMRVNAEGIESRQQAEILKAAGCDELQGFYFGEPMEFADLKQALQRSTPQQTIRESNRQTAS